MKSQRFHPNLPGLIVLVVLVAAVAAHALANPVMAPPSVSIAPAVALDRTRVLVGSDEEIQILLRFDIPRGRWYDPDHGDRPDRMPLNLTLVIDRSGSMADANKITYAREAAVRLVDRMVPTDYLGVVEYDDRIHVLWPSSRLTSPERVKDLIRSLEPRWATNLAGGLMAGLNEVGRHARPDAINRVILLSDGLANRGITDPMRIAGFVREARRQGLTVSTLGLGLDYNEDLMQAVAEVGGGNYYYVESPSQMAGIFAQEISTLFTTVAQDVRLHIRILAPVLSIDAVGYDVTRNGDDAVIPLENLYGGEQRTVLLRMRVRADETGPIDLGSLQFSYTDREKGRPVVTDIGRLTVDATRSAEAVEGSRDAKTSAEALLMTADEEHELYVRQYERGEKGQALGNISALTQKLKDANALFQDQRLDKKMEQLRMERDEMGSADQSASGRQSYLKSSKERFYQAKRGNRAKYMLQRNDSGTEVRELQTKLRGLGLYRGPIDGEYNDDVSRAVTDYQKQNGLPADGIAGPATLKSLSLY